MVLGLLILTAIPTVTGVAEAFSAQKTRDQREKDARRMEKFHIDVHSAGEHAKPTNGIDGRIVLKSGKVYIGPAGVTTEGDHGYVAEAFYIEYPDPERVPAPMGLVSQVQDNPPLLNWIYVDKDTMELKYGNRTTSIAHHIGPWDWSEDEEQVVFDDMEAAYMNAFYAVETTPKMWQVFFDMNGDGLDGYLHAKAKKQLVSLCRSKLAQPEPANDQESKT